MNSNWDQFRLCINIDSPLDELYRLWTTKAGLESWFLRTADFKSPTSQTRDKSAYTEKGDSYLWLWHGYSDDVSEQRTVVQANGTDTFQFRFSGDSLVTVRLFENKGTSFVELIQSEIPWEDDPKKNLHVRCSIGWTFYLGNLKSVVENKIDMRNKNLEIQDVISS